MLDKFDDSFMYNDTYIEMQNILPHVTNDIRDSITESMIINSITESMIINCNIDVSLRDANGKQLKIFMFNGDQVSFSMFTDKYNASENNTKMIAVRGDDSKIVALKKFIEEYSRYSVSNIKIINCKDKYNSIATVSIFIDLFKDEDNTETDSDNGGKVK